MSWVVSNTSPLTNLAAIGQFHLLEALFGQLHIADAVWAEFPRSHALRGNAVVARCATVLTRDLGHQVNHTRGAARPRLHSHAARGNESVPKQPASLRQSE